MLGLGLPPALLRRLCAAAIPPGGPTVGGGSVPLPTPALLRRLATPSACPAPIHSSSDVLGAFPSRHASTVSAALPATAAPGAGGGDVDVPALEGAQLVRDFIQDSLYHPTEGYFSRQTATGAGVVGALPAPLDFGRLAGRREYLRAVREQYTALQASWLTPVEIFQPHYGRALAAAILRRWERLAEARGGGPPPPLLVYEIGGGTGTLALNVLDWLRDAHPAAYAACQYRCVEISRVLAAAQQQRVAAAGGHAAHFAVRRHDAADAAAWAAADAREEAFGRGHRSSSRDGGGSSCSSRGASGGGSSHHCFIVACEVLDNLPHDRVERSKESGEWSETLVAGAAPQPRQGAHLPSNAADAQLREVLRPASDPLILRCLEALESVPSSVGDGGGGSWVRRRLARAWGWLLGGGGGEVRWLPTGSLRLLGTLCQVRPAHTLIAADFTQLPEVAVGGAGAPLVATTVGGRTVDHRTYLVPRGTADIFFPTDFPLLCQLYRHAAAAASPARSAAGAGGGGVSAEQLTTAEFMRRHCPDLAAAATASGYTPLLEDYTNTAVFIGDSGAV